MADHAAPWWNAKPLEALSAEEWEALCDGCGRRCLHKLRDPDDGTLVFTAVACRLPAAVPIPAAMRGCLTASVSPLPWCARPTGFSPPAPTVCAPNASHCPGGTRSSQAIRRALSKRGLRCAGESSTNAMRTRSKITSSPGRAAGRGSRNGRADAKCLALRDLDGHLVEARPAQPLVRQQAR